ncbi:hypothetical protein AAWM_06347 [Aspergillus awamori]|uniref:Uncharacterized protein n=1 Tax=Aspergillus awamori TaxID=105351 RepID=A0A401KW32_ASPAW|nr:hypothetical protein AAWM_06347 [Aspergillus awamori]
MTKLSDSAIIVIVIVVCLALVSLGAALTKQFWPEAPQQRYNYPAEQQSYMRTVRLKNLGIFQRESMSMPGKMPAPVARDVECGTNESLVAQTPRMNHRITSRIHTFLIPPTSSIDILTLLIAPILDS